VASAPGNRDARLKAATTALDRPLLLFRRLTITCPVTGSASDTGFELTDLPSAVSGPQLLIDCVECGQDHEWRIDDVVLQALAPPPADASLHRSAP
jgi:hypothetical protein